MVRHGTPCGIFEREDVLLVPLVADLAREVEVGPLVGEPVVARPAERLLGPLLIAALGPEVLDVAVVDVGELRLAEASFLVLRPAQGVLDGLRPVEAGVELECPDTVEVIPGRRVEGVA
jgi:hypothetical protein